MAEHSASTRGVALFRSSAQELECYLLVSGPGQAGVQAALTEHLGQARPRLVLSLGFCGALAPTLRPGDLVVADKLYHLEGTLEAGGPARLGRATEPDGRWVGEALGVLNSEGLRHELGTFLTVPKVVTSPAQKAELHQLTGALAVEMESFWVGRLAGEQGIPFLAVRAVSDGAGQALPPFLDKYMERARRRALWMSVLLQPWWAAATFRLGLATGVARRSLGAFMGPFLGRLAREQMLTG